MDTATQAVAESAGLLGAPAGWRRMTVLVRDLRAGDVIVTGSGARLEVAGVDGVGACCIVDFTDGTASPPVLALMLATVDRPAARGGAR